jgi:4-amino-4-deoxy-L-arabinose transferase-like glycosyltransferase
MLLFAALVVVMYALRLLTAGVLPLSGDEAYHWQWSRHLSAGYYDHPAMTAWLIRLATELCGAHTEMVVRLPAVLCVCGATVSGGLLARDVVRRRGGDALEAARACFLAGVLIVFTPIIAVFSTYISTDPALLLWWTLFLYLAHRALYSTRWRDWVLAGLALGGAVMSKFLALMLVPCALLCALAPAHGRPRLRWSRLVVAAIAAALCTTPLLWWNAHHEWATFAFNFRDRHEDETTSLWRPIEYVIGQVVTVTPGLFVFGLLAAAHALRDWVRTRTAGPLLLGITAAAPVCLFFAASYFLEVGSHWVTGAWVAALVGLATTWHTLELGPRGRRLRNWSLGFAVGLTGFMQIVVPALPVISPAIAALKWSWVGQQDRISLSALAEIYGWRELGVHVDRVRAEMAAANGGSKGVFAICNQYGTASSIVFYSPSHADVHLWSSPKKHGEDYRYWDDFPALRGQDAVFIAKRRIENVLPSLREHFARVAEPEELPIEVGGAVIRSFILVRCYDFDGRAPFGDGPSTPGTRN